MAGMAASGVRAQPGRPAQSHDGAASTPTGSRVTQSAQQSAYDGGISAVQHTSQQQNISVGSPAQGRQHDSGAAGTRYTARPVSTSKNTPADTAGTGPVQSQQTTIPTPNSARPTAAFSSNKESTARHGRNAAQTVTSVPPAKAAVNQRTVRQEHPAPTSGTVPRASGMAGMSGRLSGEGQLKRPSPQSAERARSNPRPAATVDSKRMNSTVTAQQEKAQSSQRQSSRKQRGGAERGK